MSAYEVPAKLARADIEIKKSRFIGYAIRADDRATAMSFLAEMRTEYPDARHHCWAYLLGNPNSPVSAAMSDDGEPSGTAGKPILNVLQHKNVGNIMIVVVRYFGGVKLGAGGLVRAYSQTAQAVMECLETNRYIAKQSFKVMVDFAYEQSVRHWLKIEQGDVVASEYSDRVTLTVALELSQIEGFKRKIAAVSGQLLTVD